ncbi:hypothetical protein [Microbulbifer epialgicus]|uniref:DDE superfamily endonuclease n=1 Tax=Microbulbifer epialgicus TaxID=393907 RepID=A0ABV4P0Z8_9GAMM
MEYIEASNEVGLSFATNMKKFKKLIKSKSRFHTECDIYAIDEILLPMDGLKIVHYCPGHASLIVTKKMTIPDPINKFKLIADRMDKIGTMRIAP